MDHVEGSGRYAGLRGTGSYLSEQLSQNPASVYRTTVRGFADYDSVPPSVAFASASATTLNRVHGAYRSGSLLRDDGEANIVAYND